MKIGILMCGHAADEVQTLHGDFDTFFKTILDGNDLDYAVYDVENMHFPETVTECDGWLLTGSKHGAYEDHAFIPPLETFIRKAREAKVPMVGICFGHQIIAQALGGRVEKYEGGWAVGRHEYTTDTGEKLALNVWHQDQVLGVPEGAKTTASSEFCQHAALVYPDGIWTLQPHPEMSNTILKDYLRMRGPDAGVPAALLAAADKDEGATEGMTTGQQIAAHFRKYAGARNG